MSEQNGYTVFLRCVVVGSSKQLRSHREIHFITAESDETAKKEAQNLVNKLREWDSSYIRTVETILDPNRRKIL